MVRRSWALVIVLAACGGKAVIDVDESTSAPIDDDNTTSSAGGGTTTTTTGSGRGGADGGGLPADCPPTLPSPGPCAPDGLICDYGGFCNAAFCEGGTWSFPIC